MDEMNEELRAKELRDERGIALILAMLILLVTTLIGISALNTTTYDNLISGNKRASEQAFYIAEAGINEFMGRFREGATGQIIDSAESNNIETTPPWRLILAVSTERASQVASAAGISSYIFYQSLQNKLDFGVEVKHKVDTAKNLIKHGGAPIYIARSYGFTEDGGNKDIEIEIKKGLDLNPPSALYSEAPVHIHGASTYIQGNDQCGSDNKPGIITTTPTITESGNPKIYGSIPKVINSSPNLPLNEMINKLKEEANFKYEYSANVTLTGYSDSWGTPTDNGKDSNNYPLPLTYTGPMNIVYFNMQGDKTLKLSGGSHGAGILVVDGNLEISGGFTWYGIVLVKGTVDYTAGGGEENVTGGIMAGESTTVEVDVGGNAAVIYCSTAVKNAQKKTPFKLSRWREIF